MLRHLLRFFVFFVLFILQACGTDTGSGEVEDETVTDDSNPQVTLTVSDTGENAVQTNQAALFSLRLTDAPLETVTRVVITLLAVELNSTELEKSLMFSFDTPKAVDLLNLDGLHTEVLLSGVEIPAGTYDEIRLVIDDTNLQTYVETKEGAMFELKVPSGSSSGFKIQGEWTMNEGQSSAYTIDFDVRKSLVEAGSSGKYLLKPVLRLVEDSTVGHIRGTVDAALLLADSCSDDDVDSDNAVYVFTGWNITPADIDLSTDTDIDPYTTTLVSYDNESGEYEFEAAFLPAGDYTLAVTCNAGLDAPESTEELFFFDQRNVTVQVNNILFL